MENKVDPAWLLLTKLGIISSIAGYFIVPGDWAWAGRPAYVWLIWAGMALTVVGAVLAVSRALKSRKARETEEENKS
jgi:cytochrome c biogenesis factor